MLPNALFELLQQHPRDYAAIAAMIRSSEEHSKTQFLPLEKLLGYQCPETGNTVLHLACCHQDEWLINLLLSIGASTSLPNKQGELPLDILSSTISQDDYNRIYMLFDCYKVLTKAVEQNHIDFPRTRYLVEQAGLAVMGNEDALKKPGVLFLGDTRKGKSTLINYLAGTEFERVPYNRDHIHQGMNHNRLQAKNNVPEIARVGPYRISETLFPAVYDVNRPYTLIDLSGVSDNRGNQGLQILSPHEIASAVATSLLRKKLGLIQQIVLIIEMRDLTASNIDVVLKPLKKISSFLAGKCGTVAELNHVLDYTVLAITKPDLERDFQGSTNDILEGIRDSIEDNLNYPWLREILEYFIKHPRRVVVTDIIGKIDIRKNLHKLFGENKQALPSSELNFDNYSGELKEFRKLVEKMSEFKLSMVNEINEIIQQIQEIDSEGLKKSKKLEKHIEENRFDLQLQRIEEIEQLEVKKNALMKKWRFLDSRLLAAEQVCKPIDDIRNIIMSEENYGAIQSIQPLNAYLAELSGRYAAKSELMSSIHETFCTDQDNRQETNELNPSITFGTSSPYNISPCVSGSSFFALSPQQECSDFKNNQTYIYGDIFFKRHEVLGDGDCGYTAFGITRLQAHQLIRDNLNQVTHLLQPALREALPLQAFFDYLQKKGVLAKDVSLEKLMVHLEEYTVNLNILNAYIDYDIHDKRIDAGWAHPAVLQAMAFLQNIELYIWTEDNNKIVPHHFFHSIVPNHEENSRQRIDLLSTGGNHFERLEITKCTSSASMGR